LIPFFLLLKDKDCLTTVLEVVELGVSGTKSVGKPGEPIKMKDEKELKPASMRVRDAADALLTILLEQVCSLKYIRIHKKDTHECVVKYSTLEFKFFELIGFILKFF